MLRLLCLAITSLLTLTPGLAVCAKPSAVDFSRDVLPILSDRCFHCHGPDEQQRQADLRLDVRDQAFADRGGYAIVVPHQPEASELFERISETDDSIRMPPPSEPRQLNPREVETLRHWIEQGAEWEQHWAFRPLVKPALPDSRDLWETDPAVSSSRSGIDRFVRERLQREGLSPTPQADRETLIRRVTLDLTGLPPTPDETAAFLDDARPDAYERLVDRLLASPRFGEHFAIPWLDAARYADTDGYQNDRLRYMWVWRDWVIRAFNANMPFDEFTIEQLAGDLLPDATLMQQIATGFCRNHRINSEGGSIPEEWAVEYVVDRVDTLGTVWLGLTVSCARCHDHKYDPITQREYYRLFAYFNNVPEWGLGPNNGNSPPFIKVPESWPNLTPEQNRLRPPAPYQLKTTQTSVVRPNPGGPETVMVMQELPEPRETYLLERGQYDHPDRSEVLQPGIPQALGAIPESDGGNRLTLARWLVSDANPLTPRVIVNRYWQQLFGTGIVRTSENFGVQGESPSHPELLDWLACEFVESGWDVKRLLRTIVCSATYRQDSRTTRELVERDPDNRLLARGARFRLSAQSLRDQALAVSGLLVEQLGGKPVKPYMPPGLWKSVSNNRYVQDHGEKLYRRSLYTYWRRTLPPPMMTNFNAAEREVCIVRKPQTSTPLQALTLMNNITFIEASRKLAERILTEGGSTPDTQLAFGYQLTTGHEISEKQLRVLKRTYESLMERYREDRRAAADLLNVGESPRDATLDVRELAAMTMVASTLLNLDAVVIRN